MYTSYAYSDGSADLSSLNGTLACVEVGGGSIQTVCFNGRGFELFDRAHQPERARLAMAVPGLIRDGRVAEASNLGWRDIDPAQKLGLPGPVLMLVNDGEAAALGEAALRGQGALEALIYIGIGTGIAGAVVLDGDVVAGNLFAHNAKGHGHEHSSHKCKCGRTGCLETVAAGWALPVPIGPSDDALATIATSLAHAIERHHLAAYGTIVLGGGVPRRYPKLIEQLRSLLPDRTIEPSAAPMRAKSAAAWGLRYALEGTTTGMRIDRTLATLEGES